MTRATLLADRAGSLLLLALGLVTAFAVAGI
jgi:hypothetical protein